MSLVNSIWKDKQNRYDIELYIDKKINELADFGFYSNYDSK